MAHCSYFRTRPSTEFMRYIQYLVANGITDLDLSNCPGVDQKSDIRYFFIFLLCSAVNVAVTKL